MKTKLTLDTCPITLDTSWSQSDDATHLYWISDDAQADLPGGPLDQSRSVESQMLEFAAELLEQGHDGTGRIILSRD